MARTTEAPPEAVPLPELCAGWEAQLLSAPPLTRAVARQGLRAAAWRALGAALAADPAKAPAAAQAAWEALEASEPADPPSGAPLDRAEVDEALRRAVRAGLASPDHRVVVAAAATAAEVLRAAEPVAEVSDAPVTRDEVAAATRRAVRVGLASPDPKVVAAAVALWRAEADLVDPDRVAGEGAAADAETEALLRDAAARALGQAREMASAGEVGR
jgi:hypothetical protein